MVTTKEFNLQNGSYLDRPVMSCYLLFGGQMTEDGGQKLEFGKRNGEVGIKKSEFEMWNSEKINLFYTL